MRNTQRESLRHLLAVARDVPQLADDLQALLPLLAPPRRKSAVIAPRHDQTQIPLTSSAGSE